MKPGRSVERSFDLSIALGMTGGDTQLLKELTELFLEEYPKLLECLRSAIASKDPRKIEMAAHKLKGSTSGFGAKLAVEKALFIEKQGREGNLDGLDQAFQELEQAYEPLLRELQEYDSNSH
ncbi:MAG: Hpt domain-containing protein [Acidobacteriaceae bacterium]|nr:Hpt domain-containing protein [Acidobacteriaceae bacterium]